jgi:hypothetical protein
VRLANKKAVEFFAKLRKPKARIREAEESEILNEYQHFAPENSFLKPQHVCSRSRDAAKTRHDGPFP